GADLRGANLRDAYLINANLKEANLSNTDLSGINLRNANLYDADLSGTNLCEANLSKADLSRTNLCGAILCDVNLDGACLYGANLSGTIMSEQIIQIGPIGVPLTYTLYWVERDIVQCGCWSIGGDVPLAEFKQWVNDVYPADKPETLRYRREYLAAIAMFEALKGDEKHSEANP
ncbi:MAG: pentapeptide repeat-containing protein, partial [Negativicutes bacterium]